MDGVYEVEALFLLFLLSATYESGRILIDA